MTAFRIDPASGALSPHGAPIRLPTRPIHMATDIPSAHILVAFSNPGAIRVYRINPDATPGDEVAQPGPIDPGIFAHQVRATPDNRQVILVTRGHDAADGKPEEPGALKVFDFRDGVLSNEVSVAPGRRLRLRPAASGFPSDRSPGSTCRWNGRTRSTCSSLPMARCRRRRASARPRWVVPAASRQAVGTVHVHPNGRTVYVANRASNADGENSLAVYAIDQSTGEPHLIQHIDSHGVHPRTFHIDPERAPDGRRAHHRAAQLSLFRIADGRRAGISRAPTISMSGNAPCGGWAWWNMQHRTRGP